MESPTKPQMTITMMLALTRTYNASVAFKKYQADLCLLTDPTRTREEYEKCIDTQMDAQISKNVATGVSLPIGFVPQDYSVEITALRVKRKVDALTKPPRKAKRAATDEADDTGVARKSPRKALGKATPTTKKHRLVKASTTVAASTEPESEEADSASSESDDISSDDEVMSDEVKSDEVKSDEVKSDEVKSDEVKSDEVKSDEVKSEEVKSDEVKSDEVKSVEVKSEEVKSEEVKSDDTK
jgi:hypothetical protein